MAAKKSEIPPGGQFSRGLGRLAHFFHEKSPPLTPDPFFPSRL